MAQERQFTVADIAKLWDDSKRTLFHPQLDRYWFYDIPDLLRAEEMGFKMPVDVIQACAAGNTEDTHSINLARLVAGGQEWHGGSVPYHGAVTGFKAKFAQSEAAVAAYTETIDQGNPNVQGMLDIPLKLCQPERGPWQKWRREDDQADWTRESPAPACSVLEPLKNYHAYVPNLRNHNGEYVVGVNGLPLRALNHILPRHISTRIVEDDYVLAGWFLSDPRVTAEDIMDRMLYPHTPQDQEIVRSTIYQKAEQWCKANHVLSIYADSDIETDVRVVSGLTGAQCKHNTSWEIDVASETVKRPGTETWYSSPWLHPTSPLVRGYQEDIPLPYSPRVIEALYALTKRDRADGHP